ncbi:MAG TPA: hypothetical protein VFE24_17845 [Pirellulales bacterium]|jgi:hypothetical protein|nr:hypothetical protein [Pirellulales bacterium]
MAARENQSLQIALIIFVMLTMILAVTTYLFFQSADKSGREAAANLASQTKAIQDAAAISVNDEALKKMMGYASDVGVDKIQEDFTKDMATYGSTVPQAENKQYRFLVPYYVAALNKKSAELADLQDQNKALSTQLAAITTANQNEVTAYHTSADTMTKDLGGERTKFAADRQALTAARDQMSGLKDQAEKALNDAIDASRKKVDEVNGLLVKANDQMRSALENFKKKGQTEFEIAQGKVIWINQATRTVTINLGQQDGLRKQITFGVYDGTSTNINKSQKKGSIEVIQLDGAHSALCRILDDDLKNPLMPGDVIYTPVWQPGHTEHFAMAGFFDIDGDGKSDRQRIHDMVIANGGVVDSEMDEKGKITGSMDINTKYIIIGERPTDKSDKAMLDNYTKMIAKATDLGVTQIPLHKFLSYVGYTPERANGAARGSAGTYTPPADKKDDFRPRTPPAAAAAAPDSAFGK